MQILSVAGSLRQVPLAARRQMQGNRKMRCNNCDTELIHIADTYVCPKCGIRFRYFGATDYCVLMMDVDDGMVYEFPFDSKFRPKKGMFSWLKKIRKHGN